MPRNDGLRKPHVVAVERTIAADPQAVFDVLADPAQHPVIDGSGSVQGVRPGNPKRLSLGARFGMDMRIGVSYKIANVVVEYEEGRLIAWRHFAGHRWRYTLTPVPTGTLVREEWDPTPVPLNWLAYVLMGFPRKNQAGMEQTLVRLEQHLAGART
ncbi:MAG: SRPBCC family protein [Nocardioidaceae bacterium]